MYLTSHTGPHITNSGISNRIDMREYRRIASAIAREAAEGIAAGERKRRVENDGDIDLRLKRISVERQRLAL